jgi:hypothetical protein
MPESLQENLLWLAACALALTVFSLGALAGWILVDSFVL